MITYDLTVERQSIYGADRFTIAAHADKTVAFRFFFDRNWKIFDSKAAVFRNTKGEYYIIEIRNSRVTVPWEVLKETGKAEMSLLGFEGDTVITSQKVDIFVNESLLPEDCRQLTPSETLFDRFRKECTADAYLEYENEIKKLTREYEGKLVNMSTLINEANEKTESVTQEKNREILNLKRDHTRTVSALKNEIANNKNLLVHAREKADKWDLVDRAISLKPDSNAALWAKSTEKYRLPMLNTANMKTFYGTHFDNFLTEIGLNLSSAQKFTAIFSNKASLEKIILKNTEKVTSFESAFENSPSLKYVEIESVAGCITFIKAANNCTSLETFIINSSVCAEDLSYMFTNCKALKTVTGEFDFELTKRASSVFSGCASLENVRFKKNSIRLSMNFSGSVRLTKESLMSIINGLCDEVSFTLTLSNYCFNNVFPTDAEREEIISFISDTKGWILSLT